MINSVANFINKLDGLVWGWWMILLLLGTHIFMTVRTGVIQRKIGTAIRLSVTKDTGAEGEVSQFGALTTALASTIGTGNIIGVGTAIALGWSWCCSLVLADRHFRNRHEIQRVSYRCQIPCENERRTYAGRCHVCTGTRVTYEMAGIAFCILRRLRFLWNRMCYSGKCNCNCM